MIFSFAKQLFLLLIRLEDGSALFHLTWRGHLRLNRILLIGNTAFDCLNLWSVLYRTFLYFVAVFMMYVIGIRFDTRFIINELIWLALLVLLLNIRNCGDSWLRFQLRLILAILLIVPCQLVNQLNVLRVQANLLEQIKMQGLL